jgi:hypothetical protein
MHHRVPPSVESEKLNRSVAHVTSVSPLQSVALSTPIPSLSSLH